MGNNDREGYKVLIVLALILLVLVVIGIYVFKVNPKYEYYKEGSFGISNKCYYDNEKECLCKIDGKYEKVESYYEV